MSPPGERRILGYAEALLAAVLWGSSGIFSVYLFELGVPPQSLALLRPVLGILMLAAVVAGIHGSGALRTDAKGLLALGVGGGSAVGLFQLSYQMSTDAVGVPSTVALVYLAPATVVAVSGPLLGEWPTARRVVLAVVTLAGVWLTVLGAEQVTPEFGKPGVVWGVLAGLSYAAYTLFGRWGAERYGAGPTVLYSLIGACVWLAATLPLVSDGLVLPARGAVWALIALFALVTIAGAQFLFFDALGRIEAGRASITSAAEPVVAALLATVLLAQHLTGMGWTGVVLVVIGVAGVGFDRARASTRRAVKRPPSRARRPPTSGR
ncbi:MAG: EamA family transporter [Gemmatimonadota bacterium]|nr:EamA family transporter [Gemmatimonadota bacterium]